MNPIWQALLTVAIPAVIALVTALIVSARTLDATRPKSRAETIDLGIGTQNDVMANLRTEVERSDARATRAEARATAIEARLDQIKADFDSTIGAMRAENVRLRTTNGILSEHLVVFSDWAARYYAAGHPTGMGPPPEYKRFEEGH